MEANMKKIIILLTFFIFSTHTAYAANNICSQHEGVDCSSEPSIAGNIVCNDGWVLSGATSSDLDECKNPQPTSGTGKQSIHTTVSLLPNTSLSQGSIQPKPSVVKTVFVNPLARMWHWLIQVF